MLDLTPRREDLDPIEIASRDEIAALQLARLKERCRARLRQRAPLPEGVRRRRRASRRPQVARRSRQVPVHHQGGPARQLSLRDVRRPARADRAHPRLLRHHRQADRRRLHQGATSRRGPGGGALDPRLGRPPRHEAAQRLRLRPLHRRPRPALRRRAARPHHHPRLRRHDRAPGAADRRLRARHHHGDALLHAGDPRRVPPPGPRPARDLAEGRHLRRRALDQRHAPRDRAGLRHARRRHLRPVGGDRPGRRQRVRRDQGRPAHLGGPFLSRRSSIP